MAKAKIPGPLERRHLVESELDPARALRYAEAYLADGREVEAVEFLRKGGASDKLEALRAGAVAAGDLFLLRVVARAMERPPERDEWNALADAADAAGKERYAADARRQAEREEG